MIRIITDSSANISQAEAERLQITVMPMTVIFGQQSFKDGVEIGETEFYGKLTSSREFPHTSQLCEAELEDAFRKASAGGDEVLFLPLASALSGTCSLARKVAEKFEKVTVYDCNATTAILKVMVLEAVKNADKTVSEVTAILEKLRPRVKLYAVLDTLEYLQKGGRLARSSALIGEFLKVKPMITIDTDGQVRLVGKSLGTHLALKNLVGKVNVAKIDPTMPLYFLYTMTDGACDSMIGKLRLPENLWSVGEKINVCPVIGAHIGPGAAGVVYVEK